MLIPNSTTGTGISHCLHGKQISICNQTKLFYQNVIFSLDKACIVAETSVRTLQDEEKPFIQKGKLFTLEQASLYEVAT